MLIATQQKNTALLFSGYLEGEDRLDGIKAEKPWKRVVLSTWNYNEDNELTYDSRIVSNILERVFSNYETKLVFFCPPEPIKTKIFRKIQSYFSKIKKAIVTNERSNYSLKDYTKSSNFLEDGFDDLIRIYGLLENKIKLEVHLEPYYKCGGPYPYSDSLTLEFFIPEEKHDIIYKKIEKQLQESQVSMEPFHKKYGKKLVYFK